MTQAGTPIAIFFREEGWYPVQMQDQATCGQTLEQQAAAHAELNPGTLRIEDVTGNVLWRLQ